MQMCIHRGRKEIGGTCMQGGSGNDILLGGDGDDLVIGGDRRDLLIGGTAPTASSASGYTSFDANDAVLRAFMSEWTGDDTYASRVAHVTGGGGSKAHTAW